ncbi:hypothetical protein TSTA_028820 [Talaromyces stipitatus ATCC 10500]|uniref:Uncharacterized protein n=1 Tax=Talaromyces stipitatus (strain ATCC 10500 / CBS 375.48 / QM 6759 / NRRL 1006) TaxID=441959 RepID=B8M7P7_TALSN|nr:uncharacterized protein TSTA_028820 [Talaromyces stipitatus ATCC 10500]EED19600.1 hypothetical protein TSTA_028820 [Talaromyces stipitatus ATCC 10500]
MDEPPATYSPEGRSVHPSKRRRLEVNHSEGPPPGCLLFNTTEPADTVLQYKIVSAYIAAFPPAGGLLINQWTIVCRVNRTETYQISLKALPGVGDDCAYNDIYLELAKGPTINATGRLHGMAKTFKISIVVDSTIGDLVEVLFDNNLNKYQLLHGRGNRAWMCGVLQVAIEIFHNIDENVAAMSYVAQGWEAEFPIRPGDFQTPMMGIWLDRTAWSGGE